jgi:hypothetical protein
MSKKEVAHGDAANELQSQLEQRRDEVQLLKGELKKAKKAKRDAKKAVRRAKD